RYLAHLQQPQTVRVPSLAPRRKPAKHRRRWLSLAAAGLIVLATGALVAAWWQRPGTELNAQGSEEEVTSPLAPTGARRDNPLDGHGDALNAVAFSPDGQRLVTASRDRTARVWAVQTGKALFILQGHTEPIRWVAWSPDGKQIASAGQDRKVILWDAATG